MNPEVGRIKLYPSHQNASDFYCRFWLKKQIEENQKLKEEITRLKKLLQKEYKK